MCPFTSDDTVALWVDKGVNAGFGAAAGGAIGALAGQKLLENVPFIGGLLGEKVGKAAGRKIAINSCGGMDYIRSTSDLSFNNPDDMAVYMYARYSQREDYRKVLKLTCEIYPDVCKHYESALRNAR